MDKNLLDNIPCASKPAVVAVLGVSERIG